MICAYLASELLLSIKVSANLFDLVTRKSKFFYFLTYNYIWTGFTVLVSDCESYRTNCQQLIGKKLFELLVLSFLLFIERDFVLIVCEIVT